MSLQWRDDIFARFGNFVDCVHGYFKMLYKSNRMICDMKQACPAQVVLKTIQLVAAILTVRDCPCESLVRAGQVLSIPEHALACHSAPPYARHRSSQKIEKDRRHPPAHASPQH